MIQIQLFSRAFVGSVNNLASLSSWSSYPKLRALSCFGDMPARCSDANILRPSESRTFNKITLMKEGRWVWVVCAWKSLIDRKSLSFTAVGGAVCLRTRPCEMLCHETCACDWEASGSGHLHDRVSWKVGSALHPENPQMFFIKNDPRYIRHRGLYVGLCSILVCRPWKEIP